MTAVTLIRLLREAGVVLEAVGGELTIDAPKGAVTPELRERLAYHKAAVLELLSPASAATKGQCYRCDQPVTWLGPLAGLVNWLGQPVHLRCPAPRPTPPPQREPDPANYAAMRRDIITVVQDLMAEGKKPGHIARMFGLKRSEVYRITEA